jgi:hypothetical protein
MLWRDDEICNTVPSEWWFIDPEQTITADFDPNKIWQMLTVYKNDAFWNMKK